MLTMGAPNLRPIRQPEYFYRVFSSRPIPFVRAVDRVHQVGVHLSISFKGAKRRHRKILVSRRQIVNESADAADRGADTGALSTAGERTNRRAAARAATDDQGFLFP